MLRFQKVVGFPAVRPFGRVFEAGPLCMAVLYFVAASGTRGRAAGTEPLTGPSSEPARRRAPRQPREREGAGRLRPEREAVAAVVMSEAKTG